MWFNGPLSPIVTQQTPSACSLMSLLVSSSFSTTDTPYLLWQLCTWGAFESCSEPAQNLLN